MQEMRVPSLGWENPLQEDTATLLQCSCLEKPLDGRAWRATVHRVTEWVMTEVT